MLIDKRKLELYLENEKNVLLSGLSGIGKTLVVLDVFKKSGLNWKYFSGSTLDPHIDFIGVPKEIDGKLKLIRPEHFDEENVEAIFIDEFSRSPKAIRNAIMELIQFKSINGIKFPKLKVVWAAINPYDDDHTYDVDRLDPAQKDRFHIQINVPYKIDIEYFKEKHGDLSVACEWWEELPEKIKLEVSPRRLDYALDIYKINGDLRDVLPESSHISKLINILSNGSIKDRINDVIANNYGKEWIRNENNYSSAIDSIKQNKQWLEYFIPKMPKEKIMACLMGDKEIEDYITSNYVINKELQDVVNPCFKEIIRIDKNKNQQIQSAIKNSIKPFKTSILDEIKDFSPIQFEFNHFNYTNTMISSSSENLPKHRRRQLELLAYSLPENPTKEQINTITSEIRSYASMSYYKTVENNKHNFMKCVNWLAYQYTKTYSQSYLMAYSNIFNDMSIYGKVFGAGLLKNILRD